MTFAKTEKQRWEKIKTQGRFKFGLKYGILIGLLNYIIINLEDLSEISFFEAYFTSKKLLLLFFLIVFNSVVFGGLQWWLMEKGVEKESKNKL